MYLDFNVGSENYIIVNVSLDLNRITRRFKEPVRVSFMLVLKR